MDYGYKLTTNGLELMTACMAQKAPLDITRVAMGSGQVQDGTNLADMHDLVNYVVDGAIGERHHKDNQFYLTVQYENKEHPETPMFIMNEFIVYAQHPITGKETDLLYATLGDYRQPIPPYVESQPPSVWRYPLVIVVSNDIQVVVSTPAGTVTHDDLEQSVSAAIHIHNTDANSHADIRRAASEAKQTATKNAEAIQWISANMVCMSIISIVIPATGWTTQDAGDTEAGDYHYSLDVLVPKATADDYPSVTIDKLCLDTAKQAGLCPTMESLDGALKFWAKDVPVEDINATVTLFAQNSSGSSGGGAYQIPIASETQLGVVKIGKGIRIAPDGTITPTADLATPGETQIVLDDVFKSPAPQNGNG